MIPAITVTPAAQAKVEAVRAKSGHPDACLRIAIAGRRGGQFVYQLDLVALNDAPPEDLVVGAPDFRVLVDASSPQFEQLCGAILHEYYHQNSRIHRFGGGLLGLGALICLLYLFLNRATRGYFQMNLRLAATMALVAGVLLILLITGLRLA